ncbi:hypothetical protein BJ742DRAFT_520869 [Cladochytrium replicatum]|nr:hypothetical protein BJ742DRAFT_520869 [Cladochytrium replicatum]
MFSASLRAQLYCHSYTWSRTYVISSNTIFPTLNCLLGCWLCWPCCFFWAVANFPPTTLIHRSLLWIGFGSVIYGVFQWGFFRFFRYCSQSQSSNTSSFPQPPQIDSSSHRSPTQTEPPRITALLKEFLHPVIIRTLTRNLGPPSSPHSLDPAPTPLPKTFRSNPRTQSLAPRDAPSRMGIGALVARGGRRSCRRCTPFRL